MKQCKGESDSSSCGRARDALAVKYWSNAPTVLGRGEEIGLSEEVKCGTKEQKLENKSCLEGTGLAIMHSCIGLSSKTPTKRGEKVGSSNDDGGEIDDDVKHNNARAAEWMAVLSSLEQCRCSTPIVAAQIQPSSRCQKCEHCVCFTFC
jgi:hypothetical protein